MKEQLVNSYIATLDFLTEKRDIVFSQFLEIRPFVIKEKGVFQEYNEDDYLLQIITHEGYTSEMLFTVKNSSFVEVPLLVEPVLISIIKERHKGLQLIGAC